MTTYTPLTRFDLDVIEFLTRTKMPNWTGPAVPRPQGLDGLAEVLDTVEGLASRLQYLIQAKDGLNIECVINGIKATSERFLLGTQAQVQDAADLRSLLLLIEPFFHHAASDLKTPTPAESTNTPVPGELTAESTAHPQASSSPADHSTPADASSDYSAFSLDCVKQFAMAWTTANDLYRMGFPHIDEYAAAVEDPKEASRQFWPLLRSTALPYNLLVLQKLTEASAEVFRTTFADGWPAAADDALAAGRLYGIDMTVFTGLAPHTLPNGTIRFTPDTMALLVMGSDRTLIPLAVYVADPMQTESSQVYTEDTANWIYALLALKTSLTVYGMWLGHVYTFHLVTAALQMVTWNELPATHVLFQLLAPQSHFTIPFDLLLLIGWSQLAPPTSISDGGKFLSLCNRFTSTHDFFSMDPGVRLTSLNLTAADFTDPAAEGGEWNLYPNVQRMQEIWTLTEQYVSAVVQAAYPDDAAVVNDADLQRWIQVASDRDGGNVVGLPALDSRASLCQVVTSVLYRVNFHGVGRLRSVGAPVLQFAPNYPPCLQSAVIPGANSGDQLSTADLLQTYLPKTGTVGELISFYDTFAFAIPYTPLIPNGGAETELWFDGFEGAEQANAGLIAFRQGIEAFIRRLQPDWVHIGQWPRNIEL